jgi:hypothetical protein
MKADQTKHKQMSIFNSLSTIPVRQINWLVTTWAYAFRLFIYPFIKPELFDCLYSVVESRPATSPQITVSLLMIQSLFILNLKKIWKATPIPTVLSYDLYLHILVSGNYSSPLKWLDKSSCLIHIAID